MNRHEQNSSNSPNPAHYTESTPPISKLQKKPPFSTIRVIAIILFAIASTILPFLVPETVLGFDIPGFELFGIFLSLNTIITSLLLALTSSIAAYFGYKFHHQYPKAASFLSSLLLAVTITLLTGGWLLPMSIIVLGVIPLIKNKNFKKIASFLALALAISGLIVSILAATIGTGGATLFVGLAIKILLSTLAASWPFIAISLTVAATSFIASLKRIWREMRLAFSENTLLSVESLANFDNDFSERIEPDDMIAELKSQNKEDAEQNIQKQYALCLDSMMREIDLFFLEESRLSYEYYFLTSEALFSDMLNDSTLMSTHPTIRKEIETILPHLQSFNQQTYQRLMPLSSPSPHQTWHTDSSQEQRDEKSISTPSEVNHLYKLYQTISNSLKRLPAFYLRLYNDDIARLAYLGNNSSRRTSLINKMIAQIIGTNTKDEQYSYIQFLSGCCLRWMGTNLPFFHSSEEASGLIRLSPEECYLLASEELFSHMLNDSTLMSTHPVIRKEIEIIRPHLQDFINSRQMYQRQMPLSSSSPNQTWQTDSLQEQKDEKSVSTSSQFNHLYQFSQAVSGLLQLLPSSNAAYQYNIDMSHIAYFGNDFSKRTDAIKKVIIHIREDSAENVKRYIKFLYFYCLELVCEVSQQPSFSTESVLTPEECYLLASEELLSYMLGDSILMGAHTTMIANIDIVLLHLQSFINSRQMYQRQLPLFFSSPNQTWQTDSSQEQKDEKSISTSSQSNPLYNLSRVMSDSLQQLPFFKSRYRHAEMANLAYLGKAPSKRTQFINNKIIPSFIIDNEAAKHFTKTICYFCLEWACDASRQPYSSIESILTPEECYLLASEELFSHMLNDSTLGALPTIKKDIETILPHLQSFIHSRQMYQRPMPLPSLSPNQTWQTDSSQEQKDEKSVSSQTNSLEKLYRTAKNLFQELPIFSKYRQPDIACLAYLGGIDSAIRKYIIDNIIINCVKQNKDEAKQYIKNVLFCCSNLLGEIQQPFLDTQNPFLNPEECYLLACQELLCHMLNNRDLIIIHLDLEKDIKAIQQQLLVVIQSRKMYQRWMPPLCFFSQSRRWQAIELLQPSFPRSTHHHVATIATFSSIHTSTTANTLLIYREPTNTDVINDSANMAAVTTHLSVSQ